MRNIYKKLFETVDDFGPEIFGRKYLPVLIYQSIKGGTLKSVIFVFILFLLFFAFIGLILLVTGQIKF